MTEAHKGQSECITDSACPYQTTPAHEQHCEAKDDVGHDICQGYTTGVTTAVPVLQDEYDPSTLDVLNMYGRAVCITVLLYQPGK